MNVFVVLVFEQDYPGVYGVYADELVARCDLAASGISDFEISTHEVMENVE